MSNKNILIGYNQQDFLYSRFSPPSQFASILGSGQDAVNSGKCADILNPANAAQFKADIKNNLQLYLKDIDLSQLAKTYTKKTAMFDKNGNVMFDVSGSTYDYAGGSGTIEYNQNGLGELDGKMNINYVMPRVAYARINIADDAPGNAEADAVFVDPGTAVSGDEIQEAANQNQMRTYFSQNKGQPKCMITDYCTKKHWHYAQYNYDATSQDGKCKCIPSGGLVYSSDPHVHCTLVDTSTLATTTDANGNRSNDPADVNQGLMAAVNDMRRINLRLNTSIEETKASGKIAADINSDDIVEQIYNYYVSICKNRAKAEEIQKVSQTNLANVQLFEDANTAYFQNYVNVLNMTGGILFVSYYIFYLFTK